MNPFGRLRWFLGRLISPVRTFGPGSTSSSTQADVDPDRPAQETDDDDQE